MSGLIAITIDVVLLAAMFAISATKLPGPMVATLNVAIYGTMIIVPNLLLANEKGFGNFLGLGLLTFAACKSIHDLGKRLSRPTTI